MAIAAGVSTKGTTTGATTIVTTGVATQASGSTFVIGLNWSNAATFVSLADSKGNTYTQIGSQTAFDSGLARFYYCENGVGGAAHTATLTMSGSTSGTILFFEMIGGRIVGILDQSNGRNDNSSPFTLAAGLTTTQAAEMLVSFFAGDSASNPATHAESGLGSSTIQIEETNGSSVWPCAIATSIKSSTGTFNPSWTETGAADSAVWLATFKEPTASTPTQGPPRWFDMRAQADWKPQRWDFPLGVDLLLDDFTFDSGAPSGAMTGATTVTFTPAGVLTGAGALVGAATVTFTPSATLTGAGALVGATTVTFTPSGTLVGIGALTGAATVTFSPTATLTGAGALTGATTLTFSPSATLTGTGALSGSCTVTFSPSGTLTNDASGAMSGSASVTFTAVGVLTGTGDLAGSTTVTFTASGVLSGGDAPVQPAADQPSGGALYYYFDELRRKRRREQEEREERERETREIQDALDRQIAEMLRAQEAKDAERAELARIQQIADRLVGQRLDVPDHVIATIQRAAERRSFNALQQMQREVERMYEEEEAAVLAALMLDD